MKTPDMAKENNFVLREAANAAQMGYYDHLAAGGEGDPAEERWIEALTAGADAITQVSVLESRLAQVERERDAAVRDICILSDACTVCTHGHSLKNDCKELFGYDRCGFEWRGVCEENTKEEST